MAKKIIFSTSTIADGRMGASYSTAPDIINNRKVFLQKTCGPTSLQPAGCKVIHQSNIHLVTRQNTGSFMPDCDGIITTETHLPLILMTSDCVPVFIRDSEATMIGLIHCGWKNIQAETLPCAIELIKKTLSIQPIDLAITFGVCIQQCCFEIKDDVISALRAHPNCLTRTPERTTFSLVKALNRQAQACGVFCSNITSDTDCTVCSRNAQAPRYFSWRRERTRENQILSVIMIAP